MFKQIDPLGNDKSVVINKNDLLNKNKRRKRICKSIIKRVKERDI